MIERNGLQRQGQLRSAVFIIAVLLLVGACDRPATERAASPYEHRDIAPGGIDKVYMGREIAEVLGEGGMQWLERPARDESELPRRVVEAIDLSPWDVVADIGAGTGYFTFRIAPRVPSGRVLAVDILPRMLEVIRAKADSLGADNVVTILGTVSDPKLPEEEVDLALIVGSYHEFSHPREMMTHIVEALEPGGRLVLVEYRGEDETLPIKPLHAMTEAQARKEMEAVGLIWRETLDILPRQHIMIFQKEE